MGRNGGEGRLLDSGRVALALRARVTPGERYPFVERQLWRLEVLDRCLARLEWLGRRLRSWRR